MATRSALYDLFQRFMEFKAQHGSVGGEAVDILRHWAWENSGTSVYVTHVLETKRDRARQLLQAGMSIEDVVRHANIDRYDVNKVLKELEKTT